MSKKLIQLMNSLHLLSKDKKDREVVQLCEENKSLFEIGPLHKINYYKLYLGSASRIDGQKFLREFFDMQRWMLSSWEDFRVCETPEEINYQSQVKSAYDQCVISFNIFDLLKPISFEFVLPEPEFLKDTFEFFKIHRQDPLYHSIYTRMICSYYQLHLKEPQEQESYAHLLLEEFALADRFKENDKTNYCYYFKLVRQISQGQNEDFVNLCNEKISQIS